MLNCLIRLCRRADRNILRNYQTDQPLIAHLAVDLTQTMHTLMSRFVKTETINAAINNPYKLMKINIKT